jgi:hypothetical protein
MSLWRCKSFCRDQTSGNIREFTCWENPPKLGMGAIGVLNHCGLRQNWRKQRTFYTDPVPSICYMWEKKYLLYWTILCVVCAFKHPQPLLLTPFMKLGGIPERLTQFMFIRKFIQKRYLCCHLSSPSQVWDNEKMWGPRSSSTWL